MIQGNFTVKALEQFCSDLARAPASVSAAQRANVQALIDRLRIAQPFLLPEGGLLFTASVGDEWKWRPVQMRLPYPSIAMEFRKPSGTAVIALVEERWLADSGEWLTWMTVFVSKPFWSPCFSGRLVPREVRAPTEMGYTMAIRRGDDEPAPPEWAVRAAMHATGVLLQLLCALDCRNVHIDTVAPPEKLQIKRERAGRLPLLSYKVLTLDADHRAAIGGRAGGTHASPRVHLRRGHIRRLDSGPIWVNATVVRGRTPGFVVKDYRMQGDAA